MESVTVVQSRANGGLNRGLAVARERRSLDAAHTPAHDKLEQREVEVPWIQCQAISQSLNRQDGCRIKAQQKVVETQPQS